MIRSTDLHSPTGAARSSGGGATVRFRPAEPGDGAAILSIARASVEGLASAAYAPEVIAGWMQGRSADYYETAIPLGRTVLALASDTPVGFVEAEPGEVTRLFLRPEAAGQGLGARLLEVGIELAADKAPIKVQSTLNARAFYERNGFLYQGAGWYTQATGRPVEVACLELAGSHHPVNPRTATKIMESLR